MLYFTSKSRIILAFAVFLTMFCGFSAQAAYSDFTQLWNPPPLLNAQTANSLVTLMGLSTDPASNVYGSGVRFNGTTFDYLTVKYSTNGLKLWEKTYDSGQINSTGDVAYANLFDGGKVYVTGIRTENPDATDFSSGATVVYDAATGNQIDLWIYNVSRPDGASGTKEGNGLLSLASDSNFIYLFGAGIHGGTTTSQWDYLVIKHNKADGSRVWDNIYDGGGGNDPSSPNGGGDFAYDGVVGDDGYIYVAGYSYNGSDDDIWLIKLNSSGVKVDELRVDYGFGDDSARKIRFNAAKSHLYVTSVVYADPPGVSPLGYYTRVDVYDLDFNFMAGLYISNLIFNSFTLDSGNNMYFSGQGVNSTGRSFMVTEKYNSSGGRLWQKAYGDSISDFKGSTLAIDGQKNIYVIGYKDPAAGNNSYINVKYAKPCGGPFAAGMSYTDPVITAGLTNIRPQHIDEARYDIGVLLDNAEVRNYIWGPGTYVNINHNYPLTSTSTMRSVHMSGSRSSVQAVYFACGQAQPSFTNNPLVNGVTPVRKVHLDELRNAIMNAP